MATVIPETDELSRRRGELVRERQLRLAAEHEARPATWHVLDEISRAFVRAVAAPFRQGEAR